MAGYVHLILVMLWRKGFVYPLSRHSVCIV